MSSVKQDLAILVPCKNTEYALIGGLKRSRSLDIRPITFDIKTHPGRDGGVRSDGPETLAVQQSRFQHALLILDYEGCGATESALELERELDDRLQTVWSNRSKAIVIEPEVDTWMWGTSNALHQILNWTERSSIRDWLSNKGFAFDASEKPHRPKEALAMALRHIGEPRSSSLYEKITSSISLKRCSDPAFQRLLIQLRKWFGDGKPE